MEITNQDLNHVELITIKGRVDSIEAPRLHEALVATNRRGKYRLVIGTLNKYGSTAFPSFPASTAW